MNYAGTFFFDDLKLYRDLFIRRKRNVRAPAERLICAYAIVNTRTGWAYVGSTQNFYSRWQKHLISLKGGYHCNDNLQGAYNLDGDAFVIRLMSVVPTTNDLLSAEEEAGRALGPNLYNYKVGNDWVAGYGPKTSTGIKSGGYTPSSRRRRNSVKRWFDGTGAKWGS